MEKNDKKPQNIITVYVDPNTDLDLYGDKPDKPFVPGGGDSGKLIIPPEDLSIYVNLICEPSSFNRFSQNVSNERQYIQVSTEMHRQSIPTGKEYSNARVRYLTTDYLDYGWDMITNKSGNGQPESLGIESIDISYRSWMQPEVTINFVDVMGLATFSPMQSEMDSEDEEKNAIRSLFKALYSMPYSSFTLTVKGYFGSPVTHRLQCFNVTSSIDTSTGNVKITAKFVGYKWGKYTDVLAHWVFASPIIREPKNMEVVWKEKQESKKFYLERSDGSKTNIPTIIEMKEIINSSLKNIKDIPNDSTIARTIHDIHQVKEVQDEIGKILKTFRESVEYFNLFEILEDTNTPSRDFFEFSGSIPPENIDPEEMLSSKYQDYYLLTPNQHIIWKVKNKWIKKDEEFVKACETYKKQLDPHISEYYTVLETLKQNGWDGLRYNNSVFSLKFYTFYSENTPKETHVIFDVSGIESIMKDNTNVINNELRKREAEVLNTMYQSALNITNQMEFVPTMRNVIRWLFAHYIHFMDSFVSVSTMESDVRYGNVKNNRNEEIREKLNPWFVVRDPDENGRFVEDWPWMSEYENLPEVKYTSAFIDAINDIKETLSTSIEEGKEIEDGINIDFGPEPEKWYTIFPYDISCNLLDSGIDNVNPYKSILNKGHRSVIEGISNIGILIIMRMFASIGTRDVDIINLKKSADLDARNIYGEIKKHSKICEYLKEYLKNNDFKNLLFTLINPDVDWGSGNKKTDLLYVMVDNTMKLTDGYDTFKLAFEKNGGNDFSWCFSGVTISNNYSMPTPPYGHMTTYTANRLFYILPLTAFTLNEMRIKIVERNRSNRLWEPQYLQLLSSDIESFSRIGDSIDMEIIKTSYNIVDLTNITDNNFQELYGRLESPNFWYNVSGESTETIYKSCSMDLKYIINGNNLDKHSIINISGDTLRRVLIRKDIKNMNSEEFINTLLNNELLTPEEQIEGPMPFQPTEGFSYQNVNHTRFIEKEDCILIPEFVNKLRSGETICIAIPRINNRPISLFAEPGYHKIDTTKLSEEIKYYYKSFLLLNSLGISRVKLDEFVGSNHFISWGVKRIPQYIVLVIGSILWLTKAEETKKLFEENDILLDLFFKIGERSDIPGIPKSQSIINNITNLSKDVKMVYLDYFKNWVNKENNGGKEIIKKLEGGGNNTYNKGLELIYGGVTPPPIKKAQMNYSSMSAGTVQTTRYKTIQQPPSETHVLEQLFLDPTNETVKELMNIFRNDVLIFNSRRGILNDRDYEIKTTKTNITSYIDTLTSKLRDLLGGEDVVIESALDNTATTGNKILMKEPYKAFKMLYEKWFVGINLEDDERNLDSIMNKIMIVDQYYSDIGDELLVDLNVINNMLNTLLDKPDLTFLSILSNIVSNSDCLLLPMPTLGFFSGKEYKTEKDFLNYLFRPQVYGEIGVRDEDFGVVIMRIPKSSERPTDENDEEDTTLMLSYTEPMKILNNNKELFGISNDDNLEPINLRAFGVSFGRHNESFFSIKNLSTEKPTTTAQTIRAQINLIEQNSEHTRSRTYIGENLYSVYSQNAYKVDVEVNGGSAPIFPLMYFQLNNTYLFTGGYIIIRVTHNIKDNFMITKFEGIKQSFYREPMVKTPMITYIINTLNSNNKLNLKEQYVVHSSKNWVTERPKGDPPDKIGNGITYKITKVVVSPGHVQTTIGKRSPMLTDAETTSFFTGLGDRYRKIYNECFAEGESNTPNQFREFAYNRLISKLIVMHFNNGDVVSSNNSNTGVLYFDNGNSGRQAHVNKKSESSNHRDTLHVIVHNDALGSGSEWVRGNGWNIFVRIGQPSQSLIYGDVFLGYALNLLGNPTGSQPRVHTAHPRQGMGDKDFVELKDSKCPAVLTENLFYTNKEDLKFLLTKEGVDKIVAIHVNAIRDIMAM